jgi:hypothetical protein
MDPAKPELLSLVSFVRAIVRDKCHGCYRVTAAMCHNWRIGTHDTSSSRSVARSSGRREAVPRAGITNVARGEGMDYSPTLPGPLKKVRSFAVDAW